MTTMPRPILRPPLALVEGRSTPSRTPAGWWRRNLDAWRRRSKAERREARILVAITVIVAFSIADLLFTLTHLQSVGMIEVNPIARAIILTGEANKLIAFKLGSVAIGCGCLYLGRKSLRIELAAWLCAVGLGVLTVHWFNYNAHFEQSTDAWAELELAALSPNWVTLSSEPRVRVN